MALAKLSFAFVDPCVEVAEPEVGPMHELINVLLSIWTSSQLVKGFLEGHVEILHYLFHSFFGQVSIWCFKFILRIDDWIQFRRVQAAIGIVIFCN